MSEDIGNLKEIEKNLKQNFQSANQEKLGTTDLLLRMFSILENIIAEQNKVISNLLKTVTNIEIESKTTESPLEQYLPAITQALAGLKNIGAPNE